MSVNQTLTPPSAGASPVTATNAYPRMRKRRAKQACITCHARKVKCDVSTLGVPCTNCREDEVECIIRQRARRHSKKETLFPSRNNAVLHTSDPTGPPAAVSQESPADQEMQSHYYQAERKGLLNDGLNDMLSNDALGHESQTHNVYAATANAVPFTSSLNSQPFGGTFETPTDVAGLSWSQSPGQYHMFDDAFMTELLGQNLNTAYQVAPIMDRNLHIMPDATTSTTSTQDPSISWYNSETVSRTTSSPQENKRHDPSNRIVSSASNGQQTSAWNMIDLPVELRSRSEDEIEFLRKQGCLSIPKKSLMRQFVRAYFLYVHPAIPMFLENEFGVLSDEGVSEESVPDYDSIFVLQAVLFVSCSFVSDDAIFHCGFQSTRTARDAFYRRSKLLFDFEAEKNPFSIARGALLLAYQAPNDNVRRVNCYWLNLAIRSARIADADLYYSKYDLDPERKQRLKRLWWSCIFRDRILPLGVRRPVQITLDSFDWSRGEPFSEADFTPEIKESKIYDETVQSILAKVLVAMCILAKNLTFAITAAFPMDRNVKQIYDGEDYFNRSIKDIRQAKEKLLDWYEETIVIFPVPIGLGDAPPPVVLFANLMYIYYHSGMIALSHREALLLVYRASREVPSSLEELSYIRAEVVPAIGDVTERMREVVHLKMAKYLPISAVAYLTLPWVMHILDSKFAYSRSAQAVKQRRLHIFEDITTHQARNFDGVEYVTEMVKRLSEYIDHEVTKIQDAASKPVQSWDELLVSHPRFYLRICVFIDLAFSKGEFPFRVDQEL